MNIRFGNFIEELMTLIIEDDGRDEFLSISYDDVDNCMAALSESEETRIIFDNLYNKIMKI